MKYLAIVEHLPDTSYKVEAIMGEGDKEFWQKQFEIAQSAIQFQESITELEEFNTLHINLLLRHCIKSGVITQQQISLDPLIRKVVEKEVAKTSWRLSRRKRLMKQYEIEYQKLAGTYKRSVFARLSNDAIAWSKKFCFNLLPKPLKNLFNALNQLTK